MNYKNRVMLAMGEEVGKGALRIFLKIGKFLRDAILTEVIPRDLKHRLRNYNGMGIG